MGEAFPEQMLRDAHKASIFHRDAILRSARLGCFHCGDIYTPDEAREWTDTGKPEGAWTLLCPRCGIDAVIGDASGFPVEAGFLAAMRAYWFSAEDDDDD